MSVDKKTNKGNETSSSGLQQQVQELLQHASEEERKEIRKVLLHMTQEPAVLRAAIKADVFRDLFSTSRHQSELYESLTGKKRDASDFRMVNADIEPDPASGFVGFLAGGELVVVCEESIWNVNAIFQMLCYVEGAWRILGREQEWDVYSTERIPLPSPKLYLLYTGTEKEIPENLDFSETYFGGAAIPLKVDAKCIRDGRGNDILHQYKRFTEIFDDITAEHGCTRAAAEKVSEQCRAENVFADYMAEQGEEKKIRMLSVVSSGTRRHKAAGKRCSR
ncbi:MAG: hypothetical protein HDQ87_05240 [Clostridia bacterium]|nr:hypothetical protein [Clostridia bacterium]